MNVIPIDVAQGDVAVEDASITSGEHTLKGNVFRPNTKPEAIVILNGATGVPARYYRSFARWLAEEKKFACLTYDYRDFGASATQSCRESNATMVDWGVHDQQAARDFALSQFPDVPVWIVGHSLGALCLPFQRRLGEVSRVIAVASGAVHVREHPWPYQFLVRLFWFGHAPLVALIAGYLPGKMLGFGSDLPAGVYWQWRRWCTRADFFTREIGSLLPLPDGECLDAKMKFVAIADDVMMPRSAVWKLMEHYPAAQKTQLVLRPSEYGLTKLGHLGVFAEKNKAVWNKILV